MAESSTRSLPPRRETVFAALLIVQILFGLNYVISKIVVEAFPPLMWASIRIIIACLVLFSVAILTKRPKPQGGFRDFYGPMIFFALTACVINQSSFLVGLKYTTSTNSAVLNTLIPVFTLMIVALRGQEPLTPMSILGFLSAFAGVLVMRKIEDFHFSNQTVFGDFLMIVNCFSYAVYLSFSKKFLEKHDFIWTTAWLFAYGSVGLTLLAIPDYMAGHFPTMTPLIWSCATFAVLGGTLLTYFLNNWALAYTRSSNVALWIYVQPIVAASLAFFWKGEAITLRAVLAALLIFMGLSLALMRKTAK